MKAYIISDAPDYAMAVANQMNASGSIAIMSETRSEDTRDLMADLRASTGGRFDIIIVLCHSAKDAAISANKIGGVMAVACKDQEDAMEALSSTRANVILIDSSRVSRKTLSEIVDGILSAHESEQAVTPAKEREQVRTPARAIVPAPKPQGQPLLSGLKNIKKPQLPSKPTEIPGSGTLKAIKKKGLAKSLKDAFGLDDGGGGE